MANSIPELFERATKALIVALFDMNLMNVLFYEWFRIVDPNWAKFDQFIMPPERGDPNHKAEMRAEYREILEVFVKEIGKGFVIE